jgi:hypothetical protein
LKNKIEALWQLWGESCWEYLGEILLAVFVCVLIYIWSQPEFVLKGLSDLRSDLLVSYGVAIAVSTAVWGIFLTILTTEFGTWLRGIGEAHRYSRALAFPIFVDLIALLTLVFFVPTKSK